MANKLTNEALALMCENAAKLGMNPQRLLLLNQRLTEWSQTQRTPSIAVRVLRHGTLAFEGAYGVSGPGRAGDSLLPDAIFPVCSVTKPVTATLLHILQEEGLVDLNHPVREYLPDYTGDGEGLIKIWHLLSHSSGIIGEDQDRKFQEYVTNVLGLPLPGEDEPDEVTYPAFAQIRDALGLPPLEPGPGLIEDTWLAVQLKLPPTHKPQTVMSYCSIGYDLAMEIVKRLAGMPLDEFARQKLFGPLGMEDSFFRFPREKMGRYVTRGEEFCGAKWLNKDILDSESGPGGLKSTVQDITRFGQMFLNQGILDGVRVLSPASVREMTRDHNPTLPQSSYNGELFDSNWGLGFNVRVQKKDCMGMLRSSRAFDQDGYGCSSLLCDPETDITAAFFTVSRQNDYFYHGSFFNMVESAITD